MKNKLKRIVTAGLAGLIIVSIIGTMCIGLTGCSGNSTKDVEKKLDEYMQAVYAPQSIKQFKEAKEESTDLFTQYASDRFFVSFGDDLTEKDLKRVCETYITHGAAENQSDGKERYLVTAYLYPYKGAEADKFEFVFILNNAGLIEDFTIEEIA